MKYQVIRRVSGDPVHSELFSKIPIAFLSISVIIHKRASAILTCPRGLVLSDTLSQSTQLVLTTNSPCCNARRGQVGLRMVTPHRLSSPQYISALCGEYAATNDHALWQGAENLAGQRDEL